MNLPPAKANPKGCKFILSLSCFWERTGGEQKGGRQLTVTLLCPDIRRAAKMLPVYQVVCGASPLLEHGEQVCCGALNTFHPDYLSLTPFSRVGRRVVFV